MEVIENLRQLFVRDLDRLINEIEQYSDESTIWKKHGAISNSAGHLTLHLIGNLNHFVGSQIGDTGYVRERDIEFNSTPIAREFLIEMVDNTIKMIDKVLFDMDRDLLPKNYPINVFGRPMTYQFFLFHLYSHLNYHLGQINYHRRFLDQE